MPHEQIVKLKKKQWYQIIAPQQFENAVIGETLVADPQLMLGKTLSHNLMNLSNDMKKQNVSIHFKIISIEGDKGRTGIIGYQIVPSSIKRLVRRNSEKMDLSFACETIDKVMVRVKPLVITKADVKGSVAAKVRNSIVQFLIKTIQKMKYNEVMNDLISHKMQSEMRGALNKIYPLKVCEIRYFGLEAAEKSQEAKAEAASEEIKPEESKADESQAEEAKEKEQQ